MRRLTSRFLCGRVSATYHRERFVTEDGNRAVAYRTSRYTALPIRLLALEAETLCACTGGYDDGIGRFRFTIQVKLAPVSKWPAREVDFRYCLGNYLRAETDRLRAEFVHEFWAKDTGGKPGEVFDVGRGRQLPTSSETICHKPFE